MNRLIVMMVLVIASLLQPTPAFAGFWAWLEEWSGPGPLKGYTVLFTGCIQDQRNRANDGYHRVFNASPIGMNDAVHHKLQQDAAAVRTVSGLSYLQSLQRVLANPTVLDTVSLTRNQLMAIPPDSQVVPFFKSDDAKIGPGHRDKRFVCGYLDFGIFQTPPERIDSVTGQAVYRNGFPQVHAFLWDIGPSARLHDGLDIGGGFGRVEFKRPGADGFGRNTITPLRVVMRPVLLALPEHLRKKWMGVFSIFWKETYVIGELNGAHFGIPDSKWSVDGELIRSFGINFDLTAFITKDWRWRKD
jgi:hypothetical protein